jgi:hypothetical protein
MGHASRFGGPFGFVRTLPEGTEVIVRLRAGTVARYEVADSTEVDGVDLEPLGQTGSDTLTLVTSAGGPFDSRRTVVTADLTGLSGTTEGADDSEQKAEEDESSDALTESPAEREVGDTPRAWDVRAPGALVLLLSGFLVVALGVAAVPELRKRYRGTTIVAVAGPAIILGVVLVLFNIDALLPVSY